MITKSLSYFYEKVFTLRIKGSKKLYETSLPEKEDFYSLLNLEDSTDADYAHSKRFCKDFEIKKLRECHDLYVQSDTLSLADVFENFRNMS